MAHLKLVSNTAIADHQDLANKIKLVIIDNPFANIENPEARNAYLQALHARAIGYRPDYPEYFIPFDGSDWIDRHYLFCEENAKDKSLTPIGGIKFVSYQRCKQYHIPFPLTLTLKLANTPLLAPVEEDLQNSLSTNRDVFFAAWGTLSKKYRGIKEISQWFHRLFAAVYYDLYSTQGKPLLFSGAVLQFKTRKWLEKMGHKLMTFEGQPSGIIRNPHSGFEVILLRMDSPTDWVRSCYNEMLPLFEKAILYQEEKPPGEMVA